QQRRQSRRFLDHDGAAACDEERAEDTGQDGMSGNPRRLRKDSRYEFQIDYLLDAERHHRYGEEKASERGQFVHRFNLTCGTIRTHNPYLSGWSGSQSTLT